MLLNYSQEIVPMSIISPFGDPSELISGPSRCILSKVIWIFAFEFGKFFEHRFGQLSLKINGLLKQ